MNYTLDSISDGYARLEAEDGRMTTVPAGELGDYREGSIFSFENGKYVYLPEETEARKRFIIEKRKKLLEKHKK